MPPDDTTTPGRKAVVQTLPASDRTLKRWRIADLLGDAREAIIVHDGQDYRLRITANDKLILTK